MQEELPPYDPSSPLPGYIASRGLRSPTDTISLLSNGSQVGEYSYKSDHLHINMGPRRWGARFPVYGFQDVVEGTVRVAKKCSHIVNMTVTVSPLWPQSFCRPVPDVMGRCNSLRGMPLLPLPTAAVSRQRRTRLSCRRAPSSSKLPAQTLRAAMGQGHRRRCLESPSTSRYRSRHTS